MMASCLLAMATTGRKCLNSPHPGSRREWKGGFEQQSLTPFAGNLSKSEEIGKTGKIRRACVPQSPPPTNKTFCCFGNLGRRWVPIWGSVLGSVFILEKGPWAWPPKIKFWNASGRAASKGMSKKPSETGLLSGAGPADLTRCKSSSIRETTLSDLLGRLPCEAPFWAPLKLTFGITSGTLAENGCPFGAPFWG